MASVLYNGITYTASRTRFDATRELLQKLGDGKARGVAMSLSHEGAWHHLYITPGAAIPHRMTQEGC
ncbi:hypothetical protein SIM91_00370 [Rhodococcus opacus]|uniref:hypothetical protein n=1 Tax=Rhodococcus opacus TaxID=37919 RepID=UPI0029C2AB0D|nr:hypothetical protein [Rhodococcus opacus]MDX5961823.1 hypothetical protein [Rhodococcus opacus]